MFWSIRYWMSPRRATLSVIVAVLVATSACGKDESDGPSNARPGSRLGWNQRAASVVELHALIFRVYVDDAPASLTDVRCNDQVTSSGYECSGGLPSMSAGRHILQLSSILSGVESPRSEALTINFGTSSVADFLISAAATDDPSGSDAASICVSASSSQTCDALRLVSGAVRDASSLTATPDGRLLFVERGALVRVVVDGALVPEPALAVENPSSKIVGLAVEPDFESSRAIFVAWTSASRNGVDLNITRYRELHNTLAEGAVIASGLPFADERRAPLVVDGDGLLYVALPSTARAPSAILRLTRDGFVPPSNPALSPAIGDGFARPADLAIDVATGRMWISGADPVRSYSVGTFASVDTLMERGSPQPELARVDANDAPTLAVLRRSANDPGASLLVTRGGKLFRGEIAAGAPRLSEVSVEPAVQILSIAEGSVGSWYMLTGKADGAQSLFHLRSR